MRTLVVSDIHGYPQLLENALEHAQFRRGEDRFIFAGDFLDGGREAERAFQIIEELADVALIGNHELAAMLGMDIQPQNRESFGFATRLNERMLDLDGSLGGRWMLACEEQGVFVCHSCVSQAFEQEFDESAGDLTLFAERLNSEFRIVLGKAGLGTLSEEEEELAYRFIGAEGPLWYRPFFFGEKSPLTGFPQVVGHTAPELYTAKQLAVLDALNVHLVAPDPRQAEWGEADEYWLEHAYRYGVIEDGVVRVESWAE